MALEKTFDFNGSNVRTTGTFEDPHFCIKDVCAVLGLQGHRDKTALLDADEILCVESLDAQNRTRPKNFCGTRVLWPLTTTKNRASNVYTPQISLA